eukprot:CAMPEP_0181451232 /NCGR_PEP_ID=MMETSP1110-20121109/28584_1 /TAXON_ID=174948 /ORGANISM="Symbiodinium sp., Strain CCMP421" /LENGTH=166 /DNA_ID=CAMNT_0023575475 /DNA_START=507 /DNA_END=1007 /DNA_ORIENTATION=-
MPFQYAKVTSTPATSAPIPKEGMAVRPADSGGMNLKGTSTEPPKTPTASAEPIPAARSLPDPSEVSPDAMSRADSPDRPLAMPSQLTITKAPATRRAKAARLPVMSATGAATSAGPSAPHPKDTMMAEQDQTAWAVASPALGIATKLKRDAKTNSTPPSAPPAVNT